MTIQVIEETYLEEFDDLKKILEKNNVVLLGAPTVGKTHKLLQIFKDDRNAFFICELGSSIEKLHKQHLGERFELTGNLKNRFEKDKDLFSKHSFIIIDDFFKVYLECVEGNNTGHILEILNRKKGVCIVSTPYRLEWLIKRLKEQRLTWLEDFTKNSTCKLFAINNEELAKDILKKYMAKEEIINKILVKCKYRYDFKDDVLMEKFREFSYGPLKYRPYETHTPYAFIQFTNPNDKFSFPDEALWVGFEHSYLDAMGNILHYFEGVAKDPKHLLISIGAGIGTIAFPLALIYAIYQVHKGKSAKYDNVKESFGNFQYLTYPELENAEKEAGLPPLTLAANKQIFSLKQNEWQKIEDLVAHHKDLVELADKNEKWEECVSALKQLEKINNKIKEFVRIGDIIDEAILKSVEEDIDKEYDPQLELKRQGIIPEDFHIKTVNRDELTEKIINKIKNGKGLIILKGAGGTGKTTLAIHIAKKLKEEGYFVGVPIPENISFLEYRLKGASLNSKGIVLFSEYRIAPTRIDEILIETLKLLDSGAYNCLVIVCRDEVYRLFEETITNKTGAWGGESAVITNIFNKKQIIPVLPLDVEDVVSQIWTDENILQQMDMIKLVSGGYPLYAILAADWIASGDSLIGVTKHNLIQNYINKRVLCTMPDETQEAYKYIACASEIKKGHLKSILTRKLTLTEWEKIETDLQGHLKGTVYRLSPDVFSEVVFQEKCLPNLIDYIDVFIDYPQYFERIAMNFSIAYISVYGWLMNNPEEINKYIDLIEKASYFVKCIQKINVLFYIACLRHLVFVGIPLKSKDLNFEKLVEGAKVEGEKFNVDENTFLINLLARLATNYVNNTDSTSSSKEYLQAVNTSVIPILENIDFGLENYLSGIVLRIAEKTNLGDERKDWINYVNTLALPVLEEREFGLENYYSGCISIIAASIELGTEKKEWIKYVNTLALPMLEKGEVELEIYYSMCISRIATTTKFGTEGKEWINYVNTLALPVLEEREGGLETYYSMCVSIIVEFGTGGKEWINYVNTLALPVLEKRVGGLENYFSGCISRIAEKKNLGTERKEWINYVNTLALPVLEKRVGGLENYFSWCVSKITKKTELGTERKEWINYVNTLALTVLEEREGGLTNYFSECVSNIVESTELGTERKEWINYVNTLALLVLEKQKWGLENYYSMCVSIITEKTELGTKREEWIKYVNTLALPVLEKREWGWENYYAMCVSYIATKSELGTERKEWINYVNTLALLVLEKREWGLENYYSICISYIATKSELGTEKKEWIEFIGWLAMNACEDRALYDVFLIIQMMQIEDIYNAQLMGAWMLRKSPNIFSLNTSVKVINIVQMLSDFLIRMVVIEEITGARKYKFIFEAVEELKRSNPEIFKGVVCRVNDHLVEIEKNPDISDNNKRIFGDLSLDWVKKFDNELKDCN